MRLHSVRCGKRFPAPEGLQLNVLPVSRTVSTESLRLALHRMAPALLTLGVPITLVALLHDAHVYSWDFRAFYDAGGDYLRGHSPYGSSELAALTTQRNFVYPLPVAALFAPLSLLPFTIAAGGFVLLSGGLLGAALHIVGVRDWRCYAAVMLGLPTLTGMLLGTMSPLLAFLLALLWRYRKSDAAAPWILAAAVLTKLFLWPLAIVFLATGRLRVVLRAAAISLAALLLSTVPVGITTLDRYPSVLRAVSNFEAPFGYSIFSLGNSFGLPHGAAIGGAALIGGALLMAALRAGRSGHEVHAFRAAVAASLALSPLVWPHYLILLFVPLAIERPRFSPSWIALAWVGLNGFYLEDWLKPVTVAIVVLASFQLGFFEPSRLAALVPALPRVRRFSTPLALVAVVSLVAVVGTLGQTVAAVAALRPSSAATRGSGTAWLRFAPDGRRLCWDVWTSRSAASSLLTLSVERSSSTVFSARIESGKRSHGCSRLRKIDIARRLDGHAQRLVLAVHDATGGIILTGRVERPWNAR